MKPQSFNLVASVEKPFIPGSDENKLYIRDYSTTTTTSYKLTDSEHVGLELTWFPFQDRYTEAKPRIGVFGEGSFSHNFYEAYDYMSSLHTSGATKRLDIQCGVKLAMDIPFRKGGIAPYASAGIHYTTYYPPVGGFLYDVFSPEAGVEAAVGKINKADILVNAHAQWLDYDSNGGVLQLLIGGGVGVGF